MRNATRRIRLFLTAAAVGLFVSCGGTDPAAPTGQPSMTGMGSGSVRSSANTPPAVVARITPAPSGGVVYGVNPLDVTVNLCQSSDADPGDSLRFDVSWGDGTETGPGRPGAGTTVGEGGGPDGCDGSNCCRHRHRFEGEGTFSVEARVSDKHLEDQGGGVSGKAISRQTFTVRTGQPQPAAACLNPSAGALAAENGTNLNEFYCYDPADSTQTRALKACESHFGAGQCCVITGGYNSQQYGACGDNGSGIHWHWDSHPVGHCPPFYVPGDVVSPGWCGTILGSFLD